MCVTVLSSRMLPGPLMMYQFQRSFIKAASEFVDVYSTGLKKEHNLQVAERNLCPGASPPTSVFLSPGKQNADWERRGTLLVGT